MDLFLEILGQIRLKDLIDMALVAVIIYQVLRIVHGTRALQVLIGMAILLVLLWVAISYKLYSLNWLLTHFFDSFFVVFIILFQDQIKAALASVGTGKKVFGVFNRVRQQIDVEEIIEATARLQKEKIGALIIFERDQGLANYVSTGTAIDAQIHSDLIYAIFQSKSPLHDGAVIIRGNRLLAAGCFLPLSKNIELDRHFGTRHRAALGLSEATDAIAVTVSEETGKLGVCVEGQYIAVISQNDLRSKLQTLLANEKSARVRRPREAS